MLNVLGAVAVFVSMLIGPGPAQAQTEFPTKPVEIIVPFAAGGSTDLGARIYAKALQEKWKVPVRVINLPGGNAAPAIDNLMRSPPDGYRVMMDGMSSSSLTHIVVPDLPHKITARTFITTNMIGPMFLAVAEDSPYKTLKDAMEVARRDPEQISWSSVGGVGTLDLAFRKLFKAAGVDSLRTRPVVSRGGSESAIQVAGGHITMAAGSYGTFSSLIASKKVRLIAIFADERSKLSPDIPSAKEQGFANTAAIQWNGFSGPPGMPAPIVQRWHEAVKDLINDPEITTSLARIGAVPDARDGEAVRKIVEDEMVSLTEYFGARK